MKAKQKSTATDFSQQKVEKLKHELNVIDTKTSNKHEQPKEDVKFFGVLGWLSAAAVLIASVSVNS